jgi:hypothetical protein
VKLAALACAACLIFAFAAPASTRAQDRAPKTASARKLHAKKALAKKSSKTPSPAPKSKEEKAPIAPPDRPADTSKLAADSSDDAEIRKEGGTEVKVVEFSGLDIDGQLKTPQMLYFLNRLRAEFGRPRLPHRSFMPELQRSTKDKEF